MTTCLITGGARGIGRATALAAAAAGFDIAVNYRERADAADAVVADVRRLGRRAVAIRADVAREDDIERLFRECDAALGPLTALVNSAGVSMSSRATDLRADDIARMMALNVTGLMICCREAVRRMSTARGGTGGAIVNVSSMAATIGGRPGSAVYAASKGAVDVFTTGLAKEVAAEGIRVNVVRPGATDTDMTAHMRTSAMRPVVEASIPMNRFGQPGEVAAAVVWLLSKDASFVSGAHLDVGGGGFHIGRA